MKTIDELLTTPNMHPVLRTQLEKHKPLMECIEDCKMANEDVAVIAHAFHDYSSGGGVGRKSNLTVFCRGEIQSQSWQYADKWSAARDRRDLMIISLGKIEVNQKPDSTEIKIECMPPEGYQPRTVRFSFGHK